MKLSLTENILYQSLRDTILYILLSFLVAALFSKYLISYFLTPIKVITSFAHKISKGNYLERMTWFRKDEIGNLTDSLNEMANELQSSFNQLSDRNAELESILINIVNGIIAIDKKYRIKIINKSAYEMLGIPEERNLLEKNLLEALRVTAIYEKVEEVIKSKDLENVKFMETTIGEKIFRVTISKIKDYDVVHGYIIVLQDITQIRKLESIRKDFVANVSHELKTPITSIKGFIETLKEGGIEDEETRNHFYDIINMETERLIELVEDILTLSFLDNESKTRTISKEFIDVKLEIQKAAYMLERACREKRIELKLNIQENLPKICFNKDYFRQMNINLLSNAIKYSDDGGEIEIKALLEENKIRLSISDTGIGIPSADIDRIFERFYRVDKGRARKEGGTGLGLAIVKHIAQSQGAEITVESTVEKGTTFTIYIDTKC
jgi:two-component system phosphate regulon sensor histidine kinase PhoR